ncbi:MAG: VWA domain-containing protein, partial [Parachlamydiaceae bacterium]|nr:VWA domain-containing protein [Parachlamydiaceae bacterium]
MIPFDLHYLFPSAIYLAPLILLFIFAFWRLFNYLQRRIAETDFAMIILRSNLLFILNAILFSIAWLLIVAAFMQPVGNGHYPEGAAAKPKLNQPLQLRLKAHDVIILLDASASMAIKDARQGKSRLEYAKSIADEIVSNLTGEAVSLYAFTAMPIELSPPTMDDLYVRFMLVEIGINEGGLAGTDIVETLSSIRKKYFSKPSTKLKTVIMLTDGGDTNIDALPLEGRSKAIEALTSLLSDAKEQHLRVFTIGVGSLQGGIVPDIVYAGKPVQSKLEESLLRQIANKGRGSYYASNS